MAGASSLARAAPLAEAAGTPLVADPLQTQLVVPSLGPDPPQLVVPSLGSEAEPQLVVPSPGRLQMSAWPRIIRNPLIIPNP